MGSAGKLATDLGLLRNVSTSSDEIATPGSHLRAQVTRRDHPLAYGYDDVHHVFRVNGPVYSVPEHYEHWIVVQYGTKPPPDDDEDKEKEKEKTDDEFLLSGFVSGQEDLERKGVVLDQRQPRAAVGTAK